MNRGRGLLALRLLWRQRRFSDVVILFWALVVAVASASTVSLFTDRLQQVLALQTASFLAADLAISTQAEAPESWRQQARQWGLAHSNTLEFSSVLLEQDEMLLVSVKAISGPYPLRGELKASPVGSGTVQVFHQGPEPGTVWAEKRVLTALKREPGDSLQVGDKVLTISHELVYEPDKPFNFTSLSPRILMNAADLPDTHLIQPGSRVQHTLQLAGTPAALSAFRQWVEPYLTAGERVQDVHKDRPQLEAVLDKARRYSGLISTVVMLIAGVAVAMAARQFAARQFDQIALLRCLGCERRDIVLGYSLQWTVLGVLASSLGCAVGWVAHYGLFDRIQGLLPQHEVSASPLALTAGFTVGMLTLAGFALPPLLRIQQVSPLRVLQRNLEPLPASGWLVYGTALGLAGLMIGWHTQDAALTATLLGLASVGLAILGTLAYALLALLKRLPLAWPAWHFACQSLMRHRTASLGQILALSVTLLAMVLSFSVRHDLLHHWQQHLPPGTPNQFVLNIFPAQLSAFQNALTDHGISPPRLYPVIRGRLTAVNDNPVKDRMKQNSPAENAIQRELSLAFASELPEGNQLTAGTWWSSAPQGLASVEQKLAEGLGLALGDRLHFSIGGTPLTATVSNIRSLHWDSLQPNFYIILSPGTLDAYPPTYLTSFYVRTDDQAFLNTLVRQFPNITLIGIDAMVRQLQTLIVQLTTAMDYLLLFALLAGIMVLLATLSVSLDSRRHEAALLRTLGASRAFLGRHYRVEFALLGGLAGVIAAALTEAVLYVLYTRLMDMPYRFNVSLWLWLPLASAAGVALVGRLGLRRVWSESPLTVLRKM